MQVGHYISLLLIQERVIAACFLLGEAMKGGMRTVVLPVVKEGEHDFEADAACLVQDAVQRLPCILVVLPGPILQESHHSAAKYCKLDPWRMLFGLSPQVLTLCILVPMRCPSDTQ